MVLKGAGMFVEEKTEDWKGVGVRERGANSLAVVIVEKQASKQCVAFQLA